MSDSSASGARYEATQAELNEEIKAKPLPHPGRWITAAVLLVLFLWFIIGAARNEAYHWDVYFQYLFDTRIAAAAGWTIALTVLAMLIGVVGGAIVAVLRMSENPVLSTVAWFYLWVFRGTPVYVQLVFWGLLGTIYSTIDLGVTEVDLSTILSNTFVLAFVGLGLNESAYMAEIVRAGIQAVPEGQTEASKALGMSWWQTVRRTILPQAMRIIIPPTGNEFISLLKTTSLVIAVPFSLELYGRSTDIANALFLPVPMLLVAATWYLVITSILMVGQFYLERYFARGATRQLTARQLAALADAEGVPLANARVVDKDEEHFYREDPQ
ncbi:amino acid ABC transporter permease [Corynebacterium sp. HMSC063A05]|uniref:Amino acid ABC transporter permease n=1 Tax=Corynebacterium amycolatum TaxID=43765 RepID=A0AB38XTL4_CORAY|nr:MULTISPECIES: amino acid ABC transporter permease [Corynebacterium]MBC6757833.1 amino acid ABC transporter permease [Corynebacterium sp. LK24]MCG7245107.1 amino acid ABC transporter permease [Corynebacterium sp. ACRPX]AIN82156.1 amino ABC transporter, permease, 3-TM region, His/Glu/Gln/Arg/opine family domain protein [Corynebacterium sp. ATCC 6931]KAA9269664.1 amino acid ABC transporter permease [Corynebacterium amycolatum]KAA9286104.1 amino acid ABC transporter permease [Corynebacterium am